LVLLPAIADVASAPDPDKVATSGRSGATATDPSEATATDSNAIPASDLDRVATPDPAEPPAVLYRPTGPDPFADPQARFARDLKEAHELFEKRLADLTALYHGTVGLEQRRDLQREIGALKLGIEIEILEIQLRHVREAGKADLAGELESRIQALRSRDHEGPAAPAPVMSDQPNAPVPTLSKPAGEPSAAAPEDAGPPNAAETDRPNTVSPAPNPKSGPEAAEGGR
jgi:hypothetical protein